MLSGYCFLPRCPDGGRVFRRVAGKVCPGCISETVRCRKLILGCDMVRGCRCATS